jgi:hypothetical protein
MSMKMMMAPHSTVNSITIFGGRRSPGPNDDKVLEAAVNGRADALDQVYEFPLLTVRLHL